MNAPTHASNRRGFALVGGLAAVHALALLIVPIVPTHDGPAHAWNAALLAHASDPEWAGVWSWFELDLRPFPNWTSHVLLAALHHPFGPVWADKLVLAGYTLALPLVAAWTLRQIRPGTEVFAVLVVPMTHGIAFHMGFLNFCVATVLWWAMLGTWWRMRDGPATRRGGALMGLGLVLYFTHGLVWAAAWGALGVLAMWTWATERRGAGEFAVLAVAVLPTALLAAVFAGGSEGGTAWVLGAGTRLRHLLGLETLISVHPAERWGAGALVVVLVAALGVGLAASRRRAVDRRDGLLVLAVGVLLTYFAAPDGIAGATFIHVRVMLFVLFAGVCVLAARPPEGRARDAVLVAGVVISVALLVPRAARWSELGGLVHERVRALDAVPDGAIVIHVQAGPVGHPWTDEELFWRVRPLSHSVGWAAARRPIKAMPNYEAGTGHFPLRWAEGANPEPELQGWLLAPPPLDLAGWEARTEERIGWVLVSGEPADPSAWAPIGSFLADGFEVRDTGPSWTLFRRR